MRPRKIFVAGGSGFIGTRLVSRLFQAGHEVRIFDKRTSAMFPGLCVPGDVCDFQAVLSASEGYDAIYNLAAEHRDDLTQPTLYHDVNVGGSRNLCVAANAHNIQQIIFTSSVAIYAPNNEEAYEDAVIGPISAYGRSKLEAEQIYTNWQKQSSDRSLVIIRPTVVFGEQNRGNVYNLMRQLARRHFVMIGPGTNQKSMAYVENVAAFLEFGLSFGQGTHIYNYADKPDLDMNTVVRTIRTTLGHPTSPSFQIPYRIAYLLGFLADGLSLVLRRKLPVSSARIGKFCSNTRFSSTKLASTDFQAAVNMPEALEETVRAEFGSRQQGFRATRTHASIDDTVLKQP